MTTRKASLEEGLENSANKKGYSGAKRHQYIGGALRNMQKRGEITLKPRAKKAASSRSKATTTRRAVTTKKAASSKPAPKPAPTPAKKAAYVSPALTKREKLELVVKVNKAASERVPNRTYQLYSIYNKKTGAQHGSSTFRKKSAADREAKIEMDAHNDIRGTHARGRFL